MSLFRPSVKVEAPDGRLWEVYEYRLQLPRRRSMSDSGLDADDDLGLTLGTARGAEAGALLGLADTLLWILGFVPWLLIRLLWDLPRGAVSLLGSDQWRIEAVSWYPQHTSYRWTTHGKPSREDIDELESQLARGEVPRLRDGTPVDSDAIG